MKLICLGAKNPETVRIVKTIEKVDSDFKLYGFIDNDKIKWGKNFFGYKIFGGIKEVKKLIKKGAVFCNIITGSTVVRFETSRYIVKEGGTLINLMSPSVNKNMVEIGVGNYIQENVILQAGVRIGDNSSIHTGSIISHETKIGDSVFIAPGCSIAGEVTIEDGVFVGVGVTIMPRIKVGKWAFIGAGAVVIHDVPSYTVVVGNPARKLRKLNIKYKDGKIY